MNRLRAIVLAASLAAIALSPRSSAAEDAIVLKRPDRNLQMRLLRPRAPEGPPRRSAAPLDATAVKASVDRRMRVLFDRAVDPVTKKVTEESARKAGVGIISDQFADIDRDGDGALEFSEVSGFFDARSAIATPAEPDSQPPVPRPTTTEIQIIE
jgi:hypothetical protein